MKIVITRHGETDENIAGILQGHLYGTLSANGVEQAKKLALRLEDEQIDIIYSSDLKRARDTTEEICKYHPNTKTVFVEALREKSLGEYEGRKKSDVGWDAKSHKTVTQPKGGETMIEFYKRVEHFLDEIVQKHPNDLVLLVSHGGVNKVLISVITGKHYTEVDSIRNTSVTIFEINRDRSYKQLSLNCTEHLN